ncbi:polysaccharide deacetylase family protein [Methylocaldum sp. RMAD-M]|jgi:peptidoglycan/xylan/chitin deacetylase (PgdA/CDA1 family)|uniref:polysaccharide deacetylase family protein n=2 Tax=unclassified Methylocaldum TaxID=2622260 RepID=UPI00098BC7D0|nr:polysaccharide deacetylase family protein [Methylocaldum sp. RMAD-M]
MENMTLGLLKAAGGFMCGFGRKRKLSILIYHRVLSEPDFMRRDEIDAHTFGWQMELLARSFNVLPLTEALDRLRLGDLPPRAVCITFDDGYADNATLALSILQRWNLPATFFIATGFLDGGRMWNDTVLESVRVLDDERLDLSSIGQGVHPIATPEDKARTGHALLNRLKHLPTRQRAEYVDHIASLAGNLPDNLMMSSSQVKAMHAHGMEIGGHTVNHPILANLSEEEARSEIGEGKAALEAIIQEKIRFFAYPNGKPVKDYKRDQIAIVRDLGFQAAASTTRGVADSRSDIWQLPRFTPWDRSPAKFMARLIANFSRAA